MEDEHKEPLLKPKEMIVIRYVDPTMSNTLLRKFPDFSVFGFDYSQSSIWSPLVPRFHSLSCLNTKSPEFKRKISFDDDVDVDVDVGCNVLGKMKKKVCGFGSKLNGNMKKNNKKLLKFDCGDSNNKSKVDDLRKNSPPSSKKGWKKALKMTSKQFKKKKKDHQIHHHHPNSRITLADYLQYQDL